MAEKGRTADASEYMTMLRGHESLRYWELLEVVKKFNEANIPVMLIKGAIDLAVPENRPPGFPPREMGDLDLLVKECDWHASLEVIQSLGYKPLEFFEPGEEPFKVPGQDAFVRENPSGRIDIHFDLNKNSGPTSYINTDVFWQRGREVTFEGRKAFVPSITDQVWYQLIHVFEYHVDSLEQLAGQNGRLPYIIRLAYHHRENIDWKEIQEKTDKFKTALYLHYLLVALKLDHGYLPPVEVDSLLFKKAFRIREWIEYAKRIHPILTYAVGWFTILTLFRIYGLVRLGKYYYHENVKGIPAEYLLAKYRLPAFRFLLPFVRILHLERLVILHLYITIRYCMFFLIRSARTIFGVKQRTPVSILNKQKNNGV
jgi:hypothetical protein